MKGQADDIGQVLSNVDSSVGKSGIVWVGDTSSTAVSTTVVDYSLGGGTIGSLESPIILIVNGNLTITGNPVIYGLVYVIGSYKIAGNPDIIGSNVVEGTNIASGDPIVGATVSGNGTLDLIFWPAFGDGEGDPLPGMTAVIAGSWRDW